MPSELDVRFDAIMAAITGPGGPIELAPDAHGLMIPKALPGTVPALLELFCGKHGAIDAVVQGDTRFDYTALARHADRTARALVGRHGVRPGDRVAIAMRNDPAWVLAYFGVLKAGGVAVLVNGWWTTAEMMAAMTLADPSLVICDRTRAERLEAGGCAVPRIALPLGGTVDAAMAPIWDAPGAGGDLPQVSPEDDATILFTSGSTGLSKGAVSTHRAVTTAVYDFLSYTAALYEITRIDSGIPEGMVPGILICLPMFHVTGEVAVLLNSIAVGRKMVLMPKWDAAEALRLIEAERITYFIGVPTMSLEMMQHPDLATRDVSTLYDIAAGGAPRPADHVERLARAFPHGNPMLGYGLTETNATGCTNYRGSYRAKPASTGRPQKPFVELTILGPDDRPLPAGERGEIAIHTAANIRGYWRNETATAAAFTADGRFRTGDLGYLDEDGYLFIVDRAKDIIIRGGENIAAAEVEAALYAHPAVAEACVFALPCERLGEVPGAVVHLKAGGEPVDAAALCAEAAARLAQYKLPARIWFADEALPKLGTGKVDKVGIKARYRALAAADA